MPFYTKKGGKIMFIISVIIGAILFFTTSIL